MSKQYNKTIVKKLRCVIVQNQIPFVITKFTVINYDYNFCYKNAQLEAAIYTFSYAKWFIAGIKSREPFIFTGWVTEHQPFVSYFEKKALKRHAKE